MTTLSSRPSGLGGAMDQGGQLLATEVQSPRRGTQSMDQGDRPLGRLIPFLPYVDLVRLTLEREQVVAARRLIELAFREGAVGSDLEKWRQILAPPRFLGTKPGPSGPDRSREARWLANSAQAHRGQWVAIEGDQLLASSESLAVLKACLAEIDPPPKPLLHWVE